MIQIYHEKLKFVHKKVLCPFTLDFFLSYERIVKYPFRNGLPSEEQLLEHLEYWGREITSFHELNGDPMAYLEYEDQDRFNMLLYDNHYHLFRHDVVLLAKRHHLSLYLEKEKDYINMPTKEVW